LLCTLSHALVNYYALGLTGQYFLLIFRILTVFDIIPLELVRFRNFQYSISLCSFFFPVLPLSLLFFLLKYKSRK